MASSLERWGSAVSQIHSTSCSCVASLIGHTLISVMVDRHRNNLERT